MHNDGLMIQAGDLTLRRDAKEAVEPVFK